MLAIKINSALAFRIALILLGCLVFVAIGYVSPTMTQREMFDKYLLVYLAGAALILCGCLGEG